MKKVLAIVLAVTLVAAVLAGCSSSGTAAQSAASTVSAQASASVDTSAISSQEAAMASDVKDSAKNKKIAFINCGPDDYYAKLGQIIKSVGELYGWEVTELNSNYSTETELANVNDMISKGVDAILILPVNFDASAEACKAANKAGIPFFVTGPGQNYSEASGAHADAVVTFNSPNMGYVVGKYLCDNHKVTNVAYIEGVIGSGTNEEQIAGFQCACDQAGVKYFSLGSGNYSKDDAIPLAQDLLTSGKQFDALFTLNDEMCSGALQVFKENGVSNIPIISINGKEMSWDWLKSGDIVADYPNPPSIMGDVLVQRVVKYFEGEDYDEIIHIFMPDCLTKDNVDTAVPWTYEEYMTGRANGDFEYSIDYYRDRMKEMEKDMPWESYLTK